MILALLVTLVIIGGYLFYRMCTKNVDHFNNRGICVMKPKFLWGNCYELFGGKMNVFDFIRKLYNTHPNEKLVGMFSMLQPVLLVRDPELIKQLAVKEFDNFMNHGTVINEKMDSLFGYALISLTGQKWKDMRATLSPTFTGSKMRLMFELIVDVCQQMVEQLDSEGDSMKQIEMKDFAGRFTNDIIALCAFGLKSDSIKDKDNEFYSLGQKTMNFRNPVRMIKFIGFKLFPTLLYKLNVQMIESPLKDFFRKIVLNTMKYRTENNVHRPDMINLVMEARKELSSDQMKPRWTDDELIAQCLIFFLAGFDTSSTAMSFAAYELATDPEVQEKLYQEIRSVQNELNGDPLTYDKLQEMKYLDAVVSEVLRKAPPVAFTDRVCSNGFTFDDGKGFKYHFDEGDHIWIPMMGLHMDEKYFPNPNIFDPDRFMGENKQRINPDTYMPFGIGQRNCIASRFALMETKTFLFYLLANCSLHVIDKTQIPLKILPNMGAVETEMGIWIGLKKR